LILEQGDPLSQKSVFYLFLNVYKNEKHQMGLPFIFGVFGRTPQTEQIVKGMTECHR
jgi:hypothetical protein